MLAQQKKDTPYINIFKLNSGEEFIAKVVEETMIEFVVIKPLCMIPTEKGVQFAPLMMMGDMGSKVSLPKPVIHTDPDEKLKELYESSISPIVLPQKKSIIS